MQPEIRRLGRAFGYRMTRRGSLLRPVASQPLSVEVRGERSAATVAEGHQVATPRDDFPAEGFGVSELELPLPDVPLIAEGLLMQAMQLADSGLLAEVEAILEHVAALREGRG